MAFKRLSSESQQPKEDKPWLEEWLKSLKTQKEMKEARSATFAVKRIFKVKSGKGFIVETDSFNCWVWANSGDGKQLKQDLELIQASGMLLLLQIDGSVKQGFVLGVDPDLEATCEWSVNEEQTEWLAGNIPPF